MSPTSQRLDHRLEEEVLSGFARRFPIVGPTLHALIRDCGGLSWVLQEMEAKGYRTSLGLWMRAKKPPLMDRAIVEQIFGQDRVHRLSADLGISPDELERQVSMYFPRLVHMLGQSIEEEALLSPIRTHQEAG